MCNLSEAVRAECIKDYAGSGDYTKEKYQKPDVILDKSDIIDMFSKDFMADG